MIMIQLRTLMILFCCIFITQLHAQQTEVRVIFQALFNEQLVELDSVYDFDDGHIQFTKFKLYLGKPDLFEKGQRLKYAGDSFFLIDLEEKHSLELNIRSSSESSVDSLSFLLGIDSLTNDAGVKGGVLDPLKGMYWTWRTGYINLKLEGLIGSSKGADQQFIYHLGGFLESFVEEHRFGYQIDGSTNLLYLDLDFIHNYIIASGNKTIMSPTTASNELLKLFSENFRALEY